MHPSALYPPMPPEMKKRGDDDEIEDWNESRIPIVPTRLMASIDDRIAACTPKGPDGIRKMDMSYYRREHMKLQAKFAAAQASLAAAVAAATGDGGENSQDAVTNHAKDSPLSLSSSSSAPPQSLPLATLLLNKRLQVIVKIATIRLTPEKPTYAGGAWHVEGMLNESIVASGIYYWSSENVEGIEGDGKKRAGRGAKVAAGVPQPSFEASSAEPLPTRLDFRCNVRDPPYGQTDEKGLAAVYKIFDSAPLVQHLGSVDTLEGRCLAWPNTLRHQVQPFELIDATRAGERKILVFFLVDPTKRVISTHNKKSGSSRNLWRDHRGKPQRCRRCQRHTKERRQRKRRENVLAMPTKRMTKTRQKHPKSRLQLAVPTQQRAEAFETRCFQTEMCWGRWSATRGTFPTEMLSRCETR